VVIVAAALAPAAAFGAGDQFLGSMSWHPWAADVSLLSAARAGGRPKVNEPDIARALDLHVMTT
jgi:hypothetical protein